MKLFISTEEREKQARETNNQESSASLNSLFGIFNATDNIHLQNRPDGNSSECSQSAI